MSRIKEAEALLEQCEKDLDRLVLIHQELIQFEENSAKLAAYYDKHYLEDYDKDQVEPSPYRVVDQDSLWNVLAGLREEKLQILKTLINSL